MGLHGVKAAWRTLAIVMLWLTASVASCAQNAPGGTLTASQEAELGTLSGQLADPLRSPKTKIEAASMLLARPYPQAISKLRAFLNDSANTAAQIAVAEAIASSSDGGHEQFVEPLLRMLTGEKPKVRAPAARALVTYRNGGVTARLIRIARSGDTDLAIRLVTIGALQNVRRRDAVDALVRLLDDRSAAIRNAAVDSLARLTSIRAFGNDPEKWKRWWSLNRNKPRTVWLSDLVDSLSRSKTALASENVQLRDRLAEAMMDLYAATPTGARQSRLIGYLKDPLSEVRLLGASLVERNLAAGQEASKLLRGQVRSMLSDADARVRREAALLVASMRDEQALEALAERMKVEKVLAVREALLKAMGQIGDPKALGAVVHEVRSKDDGVAAEAARALGRLLAGRPLGEKESAEAVEALRERYGQVPRGNDGASALREALLTAMGTLGVGDKSLIGVLESALKDPVARVRLASVNALANFRGASAEKIAPLTSDSDRGVRQAAIAALGALDGESHLQIILSRTDPAVESDAGVRKQAWSVTMKTLARSDAAVLASVAEKLARRDDTVDQYISVLKMLVAALKNTSGTALAGAQRKLGLVLLTASRAAEAADHLAGAYRLYASSKNPSAALVWNEWVDVLLVADDPSVVGVLADQADDAQFSGAVSRMEKRLARLTEEGNFAAVTAITQKALRELGKRLTGEQTLALKRILSNARGRQVAADRKEVAKLAAQLVAGDDSSKKAVEKLQAMGPRAVKGLLDELKNAVSSDKPNADLEKAILEVLAKVAPKLTGYDVKVAKNLKLKLIDTWLKGA